MKKIYLSLVFLLAASSSIIAQFEITPYYGYMPGSETQFTYEGRAIKFEGGGNFGIALNADVPVPGTQVELSYMHLSTRIRSTGGSPGQIIDPIDEQDAVVEYYQAGVLKSFIEDAQLDPYGLLSIGASRIGADQASSDYWNFAMGLGLGVKYMFNDRIGLRTQARLLMPLYFAGAGFGCGFGTGGASCGSSLGFGAEILQIDFTGGIVIRIGE